MKLAFLVLVKSSNALYTPKRAKEVSGLYIHSTRYSASAMNAIFQSQVLPVVSSQDKPLLKRLYEHSHIKRTNGCRMHIPIGLTLIRSKQGVCCCTAEGLRRIFKAFADRCTLCLKVTADERLGKYAHRLSDPRQTTLLAQQNPIWHTVSLDLIGHFTLCQFRLARGKHSTYKAWGLFFCDLASGLCSIEMMDGSTAEHCTRAITTFSNKNRIPAKMIVDAGPQLKSLQNNPVFTAATNMGISVEPVAPYHQFLNFSERQIKVFKGLMMTMKRNLDRSIYDQSDTLIDVMEKFAMVQKVMSLRPILIKHADRDEKVILACQLYNPTLSSKNVQDMMYNILLGNKSAQAQLFASIFDYKESILTAYHQQLLSYLQENSVFYRNPQNSDGDAQSSLVPEVNDFCTYQDGAKHTHFGIVDNILKDNVVSLRVVKKGRVVHQNTHVRTLRMIYRPQDDQNFSNMNN